MKYLKAWSIIASVLVVIGLVLLAQSVPIYMSHVTVHEELLFENHTAKIGPYQLESGDYSIWIEDAMPVVLHGDLYEAIIIDDEGEHEYNKFNQAKWATIDGVDCGHITTFTDVEEGEYSFQFFGIANNTTEPVQVFILMETTGLTLIMLILGIVCMIIGSVIATILILIRWHRSDDDMER